MQLTRHYSYPLSCRICYKYTLTVILIYITVL